MYQEHIYDIRINETKTKIRSKFARSVTAMWADLRHLTNTSNIKEWPYINICDAYRLYYRAIA
jgi:hypothetical protein